MSRRVNPTVTCACGCGTTGPHEARGLTKICYARIRRQGALHRYPRWTTDPTFRTEFAEHLRRAHRTYRDARVEDYVHLRESGESRAAAEQRLGVTSRTVTRWHSYLRSAGHTYRWLPPMPAHLTHTTQPKELAA